MADAEKEAPPEPPHDGWVAHVEHGVAELKARGMTKAKIVKLVEDAFDGA